VSQPTPLNPVEQDALVKQIGLALMKAAPQDWEQVRASYRAAGRHVELSAETTAQDGASRTWTAPQEIASLFTRLRAGMYREGRGTWFNAKYQLDRPSSYNLDFDRDEPQWQNPPPPQAYSDEMRFFPRTEENVPEWLARRLQMPARPPAPPVGQAPGVGPVAGVGGLGPRFRTARIFDGPGPDGRPMVNRPPLEPDEVDQLLDYLESAPVALTTQAMDSDRLATENPEAIPISFHTDGTWIWPVAVHFYLARYGVPPETELVQHIRAVGFSTPHVDEPTMAAAASVVGSMVQSRPAPPPPPPTVVVQPVVPPLPEPLEVERPEPVVFDEEPFAQHPEQLAESEPPHGVESSLEMPVLVAEPMVADPVDSVVIDSLQHVLGELGIPASAYRIGQPAPNTWYLEPVENGWQVGWYEHGFSTPMLFDDENDAAAFLLGKLLLDNRFADQGEHMHEPSVAMHPDPEPPMPAAEPVSMPPASMPPVAAPIADILGGDPGARGHQPVAPPRAAPAPAVQSPPAAQQAPRTDSWPIQPLRGEPPLTLFRGKRMVELSPGMELDRFGQPDGNLTYAGGTPFPLRSLVPEWINRPYHVYQLQQPLQALAGMAVPWFGQPGGGTAYVLPKSIDELISDGTLVEIRHGAAPPAG